MAVLYIIFASELYFQNIHLHVIKNEANGIVPINFKFKLLNVMLTKFQFFFLFRAALAACGGSQARGQIGATAAGLHHNHSHAGSLTH